METINIETTVTGYVTKDDERKALAKIKKIVESLGVDSYIGTAFNGAWDIAIQNIDYDWGFSVSGYISGYSKLETSCMQKDKEIDKLKKDIIALNETNSYLNEKRIDDNKELLYCSKKINNLMTEVETLNLTVKSQVDELIELKAKLYDFMIKGGDC